MSPEGTFTDRAPRPRRRASRRHRRRLGHHPDDGASPTTVLAASDTSRFTLVYTNRSTLDVMFLEELADLKDRYPARLALHHVLSREQRAAPLLSGRIDADEAARPCSTCSSRPSDVDRVVPLRPVRPRRSSAATTLAERGVPADRIRFELFTTDARARSTGDAGRPVVVRPDEETYPHRVHPRRASRRPSRSPVQRATRRSSTRRCACAPTCRSPAPAACAAPAAPGCSTARSR